MYPTKRTPPFPPSFSYIRALHNKYNAAPQRSSSSPQAPRDRPAREGQCGVEHTPPVACAQPRVAPLSTSLQHARPPHSTLCLGGSLNLLLAAPECTWSRAGDTGAQWRRLARAPYEHPRHSGWAPSGSAASWDAELLRATRRARLRSRAGALPIKSFGHII